MREDPIIAEIHKIRREIIAEFGGDLKAYVRHIQALEEAKQGQGVQYFSFPPRRPEGYKPDAA